MIRGRRKIPKRGAATPEAIAQAKTFYIFGYESEKGKRVWPSLKKAGKIAGVSYFTLSRLAADEDWQRERELSYMEFYNKLKEAMIARHVEESVHFRESLFQGARLSVQLINARLGQIATKHQEQVQAGQIPADEKSAAVRAYVMRDLGMSLETFKRVGIEALGEESMSGDFTWKDLIQQARGSSYGDGHGPRKAPYGGAEEGSHEEERSGEDEGREGKGARPVAKTTA